MLYYGIHIIMWCMDKIQIELFLQDNLTGVFVFDICQSNKRQIVMSALRL